MSVIGEKVYITTCSGSWYGYSSIYVYDTEEKAVAKLLSEVRKELDIPSSVPDDGIVAWVKTPENMLYYELDRWKHISDHLISFHDPDPYDRDGYWATYAVNLRYIE